MSCTIPAIENRYRQSNPELADKLNQQTFDTWNTLLDSKLFEEKDNELYVNKEGTKKRVKQDELIDSINNHTPKEGIDFVFEANPELANAVYEALGFSQMIIPNDKIVFGHPTIGKSFLKNNGENSFLSLDDDYGKEITDFVDANRGTETRQEYKGRKPKEYNQFVLNLYDKLKIQAKKEGKTLFVSNTNILKERMSDFDKVITIPKEEFKRRFDERGATYGFEDWKSDIDATVAKVSNNKVINTTGYLADLLITPQQKQQAQQQYSQYLDTIFPDSKVKDIQSHFTVSEKFEKFDKSKIGNTGKRLNLSATDNHIGIFFTDKTRSNIFNGEKLGNTEIKVLLNITNSNSDFYDELEKYQYDSERFIEEQEPQIEEYEDGEDEFGNPIFKYREVKQKSIKEKTTEFANSYVKTLQKKGVDGIITNGIKVVFEPEQIHILGSKQDIEGFEEFVKKQPQTKDIVQITEDNKVSVDVLRSLESNEELLTKENKVDSKFSPAQLSDNLKSIYSRLLELNNYDQNKTTQELLFTDRIVFTKAYTNELGEDVGLFHLKSEENPRFIAMNGSLEDSLEGLRKDYEIINNVPLEQLITKLKENSITRDELSVDKILSKLSTKFNIPYKWVTGVNEKGGIKDGILYINKDSFTMDTAFHEFAHPFIEYLSQINPTVYKILIANSSKVINKNTGKTVKEEVESKYKDYSKKDLEKEIIAEAIGLAAVDQLLEENKTSFFDVLSKFLKILGNFFGIQMTLSTPFRDIANTLFSENYKQDLSQFIKGDYYQRNDKMTKDEVKAKFKIWNDRFELEPVAHKYKDNELNTLLDSVNTLVIKPLYKDTDWKLKKDEKSQIQYQYSASFGTAIHNLIQYLIDSNLNEDKTIKDVINDFSFSDILENNLNVIDDTLTIGNKIIPIKGNISMNVLKQTHEFVKEYLDHLKDVHGDKVEVYTEQKIYNESYDIAGKKTPLIGTADIVLLREDGSYFIHDWKTTQTEFYTTYGPVRKEGVDPIKKLAYKEQLITYGKMLGGNFIEATAYPIGANFGSDFETGELLLPHKLEFPKPNPLSADINDRVLFPVVIGGKEEIKDSVAELISKLRYLQNLIKKGTVSLQEEDYYSRVAKIKPIERIIEDLETKKSINSLIYEVSLLLHEISLLLPDMDLDMAEKAQRQLEVYLTLSKYFKNLEGLSEIDRDKGLGLQYKVADLYNKIDERRSILLQEEASKENIQELNKPEKKYSMWKWLLKGISTISDVKTISLFHKLKDKLFNKSDFDAKKDLTQLVSLENGLKEYGKKHGLSILQIYHKFLRKDEKSNPTPFLIKRIKEAHYLELEQALLDKDLAKIAKFVDLVEYNKKLALKLEEEKVKWTKIYENYVFNPEQIANFRAKVKDESHTDAELQDQMRLDSINSKVKFYKDTRTLVTAGSINNLAVNFLFGHNNGKAFIKDYNLLTYREDNIQKYHTAEYQEILNDKDLKSFYDFMIAQNTMSYKLANIQYKQINSFVPSVLASSLEKMERGDLGTLSMRGLGHKLSESYVDENAIGKREIDLITGNPLKSVPVLYQNNFTKYDTDSEGNVTKDYKDYSLDLGAIYALYSMELHNFQARATLLPYGEALLSLEKTKKNVESNRFGVITDPKSLVDAKENVKFVEDIVNRDVYNITHATTKDVALSIKVPTLKRDENGKRVLKFENKKISGTKSLRGTVAFNSYTNLGMNALSAAATFFGGSINAYFESSRSEQMSEGDYRKSIKAVSSIFSKTLMGDKNLTLINLIDPMLENENLHRAVKLSSTKLRKIFNTELLFEMMRRADRSIQYGVALAVTRNYMVQDSQLFNITEYVRANYESNGMTYKEILASRDTKIINEARKAIIKETELLKETKSVYVMSNMKGDELETPLTEDLIYKLRSIIRKQNAQIIGNLSQRDKIGLKNYALGGALMQYRNWMPSLIYQRFGDAEMDNDLNRLNWGKSRTFLTAVKKDFFSLIKSTYSGLNDVSLNRIQEVYDDLLKKHIDKGGSEANFETFENFTEYYLNNLRSQMKEIAAILSFLVMFSAFCAMVGWDDDDKDKSGTQKFTYKLYSKLLQELTFFYSPSQTTSVFKNILPVLSTLENVEKLGTSLITESFYRTKGFITDGESEEKHIKQNSPMKYMFKLPVAKEVTTWWALFDDDFRKEYNITIQH